MLLLLDCRCAKVLIGDVYMCLRMTVNTVEHGDKCEIDITTDNDPVA